MHPQSSPSPVCILSGKKNKKKRDKAKGYTDEEKRGTKEATHTVRIH